MSQQLTTELLTAVVPPSLKSSVTTELVETINSIVEDDIAREAFKDNFLGYTSVLKNSRYSIKAYTNAVKYVTYILLENTNLESYVKVFPDRYQSMVDKDYPEKDINSAVSSYDKSSIIIKIKECALIPTHLLNADLYQKAINRLGYLMIHANSEKVQSDSAGRLVDALTAPESIKIEMDVGVKEDSIIQILRDNAALLVAEQRKVLASGAVDLETLARRPLEAKVIEGEVVTTK